MKYILLAVLAMVLALSTVGQAVAQKVQYVKVLPGYETSIKWNLSQGKTMNDLSWAWNSSVACFPAIRQKKFTGHHVLYFTDLPKYSDMEITLIPDNPADNLSLYAYEVGKVSAANTVPNLNSCIRCETDFKWEFERRGQTQDHTRKVRNLIALNHPYQVVIGVAGANGLNQGKYTLRIKINSR